MKEMFVAVSDVVFYISVAIAALALALYGRLDSTMKIFVIYVVVGGCVEMMSDVLNEVFRTNLPLLHLYTLLELLLLSVFFKFIFLKLNRNFPIGNITVVVASLCILNSLFVQPIDTFNTYSTTIVSLIIIAYCVITFYLFLDGKIDNLVNIKWIVGALLIYQVTSFLVLASANIFLNLSVEGDDLLWLGRAIILLIVKLVFVYAIIKSYQASKLKIT